MATPAFRWVLNRPGSGVSSSTFTPTTGTATGDWMFLGVSSTVGASSVTSGTDAWTKLYDNGAGLQFWQRKVTSGNETSTVTVTFPSAPSDFLLQCSAYSGATSTPVVATAASLTAPAVAVLSAGVAVRVFAARLANSAGASLIPPATSRNGTLSGNSSVATSDASAAVGAGTTATATTTNTVSSSAAITLVLNGNLPPNAPTLNGPIGSATIDRTITQRFSWTFSDPDSGDTQSAFDLRYSSDSGATWTTVSGTTPNNYVDIASGTLPAGSYQWQVRTYDALGVVGSYSASAFFAAATPPTGPTITAPTSGATIGTTPIAVAWSFPTQQAYQVRRVADSAGAPDTGTVYYDTGQVTDSVTRSLAVPFDTNGRYEHVQVRVEASGLWSAWVDVRVQVSYTAPPTPTVTLTADNTNAWIAVTVATPAPTGSNPAATYVDIYRSDDAAQTSTRVATLQPINGTWTDHTPASGVSYSYCAVAVASTGVTATSTWVDAAGTPADGGATIIDGGTP